MPKIMARRQLNEIVIFGFSFLSLWNHLLYERLTPSITGREDVDYLRQGESFDARILRSG